MWSSEVLEGPDLHRHDQLRGTTFPWSLRYTYGRNPIVCGLDDEADNAGVEGKEPCRYPMLRSTLADNAKYQSGGQVQRKEASREEQPPLTHVIPG